MTPAYARVLGAQFQDLAPELRALHGTYGTYTGQITVTTGSNALLRGLARLAGFPPAGERMPFTFITRSKGNRDLWQRQIGHTRMSSQLWATSDAALAERIGLATGRSRLQVTPQGGLSQTVTGLRVLGCPLPRVLAPDVTTHEGGADGFYRFDITIRLPLIGALLVRYRGFLKILENHHQTVTNHG